jgi:hypothetical protein
MENIYLYELWELHEDNYFCPELFNKGFGSYEDGFRANN